LAAHVGKRSNGVLRQLPLQAQVPLLGIRTNGVIRNGGRREREEQSLPANVCVAGHVGLRGVLHQGRGALQRFRVASFAVGVVVEDSVASAERVLSISK